MVNRKIALNLKKILSILGEDPEREGLKGTPRRYARSMNFLTAGYQKDIKKVVGKALFHEASKELVIVRDIEFFSLCEHHLLPFFGKAHVAYIPNGKIIGLSKIPRIIDVFARRFQVQERLTVQVAEALTQILNPAGLAVMMDASHLCMMMRGVEKQGAMTLTTAFHGTFKNDQIARQELLQLLK